MNDPCDLLFAEATRVHVALIAARIAGDEDAAENLLTGYISDANLMGFTETKAYYTLAVAGIVWSTKLLREQAIGLECDPLSYAQATCRGVAAWAAANGAG